MARLSISLLILSALAVRASADGGMVRLSREVGAYRVTLFSAPTPFRAGPVDLSLLLQDAETGAAILDAEVLVRVRKSGGTTSATTYLATHEQATNKLYYSALFELPSPGLWELETQITGALGSARVSCSIETAPPTPTVARMWPWIGWPVAVIVLFAIHRTLRRRSDRFDAPASP